MKLDQRIAKLEANNLGGVSVAQIVFLPAASAEVAANLPQGRPGAPLLVFTGCPEGATPPSLIAS